MNRANWKDTAELIGIAAIVASLVFVGIEIRQSQRIAFADQEGAQIADFMELNNLIASNSGLIGQLNNHEPLTDAEMVQAKQLVSNIWMMHFFTRQRANYLDHPSVGVHERAVAIIFFENPGLRQLWASEAVKSAAYFAAMERQRGPAIRAFDEAIEMHLASLDAMREIC